MCWECVGDVLMDVLGMCWGCVEGCVGDVLRDVFGMC